MNPYPRHSDTGRSYARSPSSSPRLVLPGPESGRPSPSSGRRRRQSLSRGQRIFLVSFFLLDILVSLSTGMLAATYHAERLIPPLLSSLHIPATSHSPAAKRQPTPRPSVTAPPTASATTLPPNMVAEDTFQRSSATRYWGIASDDRWRWGEDANSSPAFSIAQNTGVISGQGSFTATLGPVLHDEEATVTATISSFNLGNNLGEVLRWRSASEWYKVYIDGTHLVLLKRSGSRTTQLASVPFFARSGTAYTVRFRASGEVFQAEAWAQGSPEPGWQLSGYDTEPAWLSGQGGIRVYFPVATTVHVREFEERNG